MKENQKTTKQINKIALTRNLIFAGVILLCFFALFFLFTPKSNGYRLQINVLPEGSTIEVNNDLNANNSFDRRLDPGEYKILSYKDGYEPDERTIELREDTSISISLQKMADLPDALNPSAIQDVDQFGVAAITLKGTDTFVAIEGQTGKLVRFSDNGKKRESLYDRNIYTYDYNEPYVVIVDRSQRRFKVIVLNTATNTRREYETDNLQPIISIALSSDNKKIFVVGNYSETDFQTTLYETPIDTFDPKAIFSSKYDDIETLTSNKLLFVETAEAIDSGAVSVFDIETKKITHRSKGNKFIVSPNKDKVAILQENQILILDVNSLQIRTRQKIAYNPKMTWKNNNVMVVVENEQQGGVSMYYLDSRTFGTTEKVRLTDLGESLIRFVEGATDNMLFLTDTEGRLLRVKLP